MKKTTINALREHMAEEGFECTPKQIKSILMKLGELHEMIIHGPSFEYISLEEKQALRYDLAVSGEELTLNELDEIIDLANKIRNFSI